MADSIQQDRILVIDDLPNNLRLLSQMLTLHGYEVRLVPDGRLAVASITAFQPDLILLDIKMPGLDGYEVCQTLKSNPNTKDIPVIFLSALNEAFDKVKGFKVGASDYISKPFQVEEVLARIQHQLKIKKLQNQLLEKQKELESEIEERKKAENKAQIALQAKSNFLANMSHELRTPMNAILGFTEILLRSHHLPLKDKDYLSIISKSGQHLLTLINDVLDMSKIEAGCLSLNEKEVSLYDLLQDIQSMLSLKADNKGLDLVLDCDPDVPQFIKTDELKLRQVLINLMSNGIKFTQQGSVTLRVRKIPQSHLSKTVLHFEVEDTGTGIAPEEMEKLFQPFEQTQSSSQSSEGTGLGLAISQKFVQFMGGEITVRSVVNQGSCFSFALLVSLSDSPVSILPQVPKKSILRLADNQPTYRILVADDTRLNRLLLVKLLTDLGFEVQEAVNGEDAIALWLSWRPHLIFMDMRMPKLDGFEATQRIRTQEQQGRFPYTPIIALTASLLHESRSQILATGCDDVVYKPFSPEDLYNTIAQQIGVRYLYQEDELSPFLTPKAVSF